jgi:hypothetical protein
MIGSNAAIVLAMSAMARWVIARNWGSGCTMRLAGHIINVHWWGASSGGTE